MIGLALTAFNFIRTSWIGKGVALVFGLLALWGLVKLRDRKLRKEGAEEKRQSDLKQIDNMVKEQKEDERKHSGLKGDDLEKALLDQQQEYRR